MARATALLEGLAQDFRLGWRGLRRGPGLVVAATLTLGLGIGAATLIFSVISALFLRPLPGAQPERLVSISTSDYSGDLYGGTSYPDFADLRQRLVSFEGLLASTLTPASLTDGAGEPARALVEWLTPDAFDVLGLPPALGRAWQPADDVAPAVAVLSDALWRRRFGADPGVLGRTLHLNGQPLTVAGVAPAGFRGLLRGLDVDLWLPLRAHALARPGSSLLTERGARALFVMARLKPGVRAEQAQAELDLQAAALHRAEPEAWTDLRGAGRRLTLRTERDARVFPAVRGPLGGFLALLLAGVALVLLVACVNLAGLLLARASARRREIGVRLALGAGRARLARQLLAESLLLALPGGALGVLLAAWGAALLQAVRLPLPVPIHLDLNVDVGVLGFALGVTLLASVAFGLAPAWQATRFDLLPALRDGGGTLAGAQGLRLRRALVTAQVAVALLLLGSAGLFLRSLASAHAVPLGFDPRGVLLVPLELSLGAFTAEQARAVHAQALEHLSTLPGVEVASLTTHVPLALDGTRRGTTIEGYSPRPGEDMEFWSAGVAAGYFETLRLPLLRGRGITRDDVFGAPGVAVVNEAFARRYLAGAEPLGRRLSFEGDQGPWLEVVGVARDAKLLTLGEQPRPMIYTALPQGDDVDATLLLRTAGDPAALAPAVRAALVTLDRRLPLFGARTLDAQLGLALLPARAAGLVLGCVGALALALCAIGLYGVMAWSVARRTRELALRMALGAGRTQVLRLVARQGLTMAALGLLFGLALTLLSGQALRGFLYGIGPADPLALAGACGLLASTALLACLLPARRATRVDPAVALRAE